MTPTNNQRDSARALELSRDQLRRQLRSLRENASRQLGLPSRPGWLVPVVASALGLSVGIVTRRLLARRRKRDESRDAAPHESRRGS